MEEKILIIFVETFRGYCANAEHYYAKIGFVDRHKFDFYNNADYENFPWHYVTEDKVELRYFPTEEEALKLAEKESNLYAYVYNSVETYGIEREKDIKNIAEDYLEYGTRGFPSLYKIIETVTNNYPDYKWVGLFESNIKDFEIELASEGNENNLINKNKYVFCKS